MDMHLLLWWLHIGTSSLFNRKIQDLPKIWFPSAPLDGQHSYPMLLSKASPSSHRFLTQSPLATQRQNFSNSSLPFPHPQNSSLLDHSHQPKNTPLFLLSSIIILITSKSHTVTPYFSTLLGNNTPQNRCLFLETWVLLLPWSLKSFQPGSSPPPSKELSSSHERLHITKSNGQCLALTWFHRTSLTLLVFSCLPRLLFSSIRLKCPGDSISSYFTLTPLVISLISSF